MPQSYDVGPNILVNDVRRKMQPYVPAATKFVELEPAGHQVSPDLQQYHVAGTAWNEVVFVHHPSRSLLAIDMWYGGCDVYDADDNTAGGRLYIKGFRTLKHIVGDT